MLRSTRRPGDRQAGDILDAYLAARFGVGLEQVLLDGAHGTTPPAVAGAALGTDTVVTMPQRFLQRPLDGQDVLHTEAEVHLQIRAAVEASRCLIPPPARRLRPQSLE